MKRGKHLPTSPPHRRVSSPPSPGQESDRARAPLAGTPSGHRSSAPSRSRSWGAAGSVCLPGWAHGGTSPAARGPPSCLPVLLESRSCGPPKGTGHQGCMCLPAATVHAGLEPGARRLWHRQLGTVSLTRTDLPRAWTPVPLGRGPCRRCVGHPRQAGGRQLGRPWTALPTRALPSPSWSRSSPAHLLRPRPQALHFRFRCPPGFLASGISLKEITHSK